MKIRAAIAATFLGLMIGFIAVVGDPPPRTWVADVLLLSILMGGIFLLVTRLRDVVKQPVRLFVFFACVSLFLDYSTSVVSFKGEFLEGGGLIFYPVIIVMFFIVALLYAATLKIVRDHILRVTFRGHNT